MKTIFFIKWYCSLMPMHSGRTLLPQKNSVFIVILCIFCRSNNEKWVFTCKFHMFFARHAHALLPFVTKHLKSWAFYFIHTYIYDAGLNIQPILNVEWIVNACFKHSIYVIIFSERIVQKKHFSFTFSKLFKQNFWSWCCSSCISTQTDDCIRSENPCAQTLYFLRKL